MAEQINTSFTVKGKDSVIDPEQTFWSLNSIYRNCHLENPTSQCFAGYDEESSLEEFPVLTNTGTFLCADARSQLCGDRIVEAAKICEDYHRRLYKDQEGVQVSVAGQI